MIAPSVREEKEQKEEKLFSLLPTLSNPYLLVR
jgi:hypothetical protein